MSGGVPVVVRVHQALAAVWPAALVGAEVADRVGCTLAQARNAIRALKRQDVVEPVARQDVTIGFAWRLSL